MPRKPKVKKSVIVSLVHQPRKSPAGRKCSVCTHAQVDEINSEIAKSSAFRYISLHFGMSAMSVQRHTENCLKLDIAALIAEKRIEGAINHYEEIREQLKFAKDLQEAARLWLTDPETGKLTLLPRADEVSIIYLDYADLNASFEPKKKKALLQDVIDNIQSVNANFSAQTSIIKTTDLRDYALNTIKICDVVLDKFARVDGHYTKEKENPEEFTTLKSLIQKRAQEKGISYQLELKTYLDKYAVNVRPEIKRILQAELG
ncbi:MAG TPA: hypothetical protein VNI60_10820 [Pyrinomonadaceae bacterium]|nr:hypothetical protein [Pyrinomonadaceae bacterium]